MVYIYKDMKTRNDLNIIGSQQDKGIDDVNLISLADEGDTSVFLHDKTSGQENC